MILSHDEETIVARCTPAGSGALALIRLSGLQALEIASKISVLPNKKLLLEQPTHTIAYGWVVDSIGHTIDQVLFLIMHGPHTFTGQHTVEITCHNNPFLVEQIIAQTILHGARLAQEGEFTKRAVLNNKIDLIQAEAINELIHANTQHALKKSLAQLQGSFSSVVDMLEKELLKAIAFCEASFEFIDEEMQFDEQIKGALNQVLSTIAQLKINFDQQQQIKQGIRIALIGSVNAGKSSLFNSLLGTNRAIVTPIAGTTRDSIEAGLYKNNNYWTLIDTAGLRNTDDVVEQEGIKRSREEAQKADIILLVFDGSRNLTAHEATVYQELLETYQTKIIPVITKTDLPYTIAELLQRSDPITVSTQHKNTLASLEKNIETKIQSLFQALESPFLLNQRQYNLLLALEQKLHTIAPMLQPPLQYELLSYHLNDASAQLAQLTGKSISEASMDAVFREFCVGK